jgi:hypothetical protein
MKSAALVLVLNSPGSDSTWVSIKVIHTRGECNASGIICFVNLQCDEQTIRNNGSSIHMFLGNTL